jgi:acyl-coenzyme A thioesterase PaaI-like protein
MHEREDCAEPRLNAGQVEQAIIRNLPTIDHHDEVVESVGPNSIRIRLPYRQEFMGTELWQDGSGGVFSGPTVMGIADTTMYGCVLAALGPDVIPVMANFNITFLQPAKASDLIAEARIVRRGGRLHYLECWLTSDGERDACAHITSTYRVAARLHR